MMELVGRFRSWSLLAGSDDGACWQVQMMEPVGMFRSWSLFDAT